MDTNQQDPHAKAAAALPARRRKFSRSLKRQIVQETLNGESCSVVARRHDINANQLFKWRRLYREGLLEGEPGDATALLPITMDRNAACSASSSMPTASAGQAGSMAIDLARGHRLVVTGSVCPSSLRTVLEVLARC